MKDIGYVTARNLFQPEDLPPHAKLSAELLRDSRRRLAEIRKSVDDILKFALAGARDLQTGNCWSENIDTFESRSMDQARALATFPIGTNHPKLGPRIFHARAAFVAFRESVRWEVVGKIAPDMPKEDVDDIVDLVSEYARQAAGSIQRAEEALANFSPD